MFFLRLVDAIVAAEQPCWHSAGFLFLNEMLGWSGFLIICAVAFVVFCLVIVDVLS